MATDEFPLPQIVDALAPYIKPREEVTNIRRSLRSHLQSCLPNDTVPLSTVNLALPSTSELDSPPLGLAGVHKAYWKALQAHNTAQTRYNALKTELDQRKYDKAAPNRNGEDLNTSSSNDDYIALLRQREKYRKLKVIETALSDITSAGGDTSSTSLDETVKNNIGDLPMPPSAQPTFDRNPEVESRVVELKKAVVSAKRKVEQQKRRTAIPATNGTHDLAPEAEIAGLQNALQELTSWMENQLTMIANSEAEAQASVEARAATNGTSAESKISTNDIEALYEQYLEARQRLIRNVNDAPSTDPDSKTACFGLEVNGSRTADPSKTPSKSSAEVIISSIPALLAAKQEEQALVQQSAYVRRQLSAAEAETARVLRRLAEESHLVPSEASQGKDWADAADDAGAATASFTKQRIDVGEASVSSAKETLAGIKSLPESLDGLLGRS